MTDGYALGDALLGGRETDDWWQSEVTRMVSDLMARDIKVSRQVEKMARWDRHGMAAAFLRAEFARTEAVE